jgi:hypothetical protein
MDERTTLTEDEILTAGRIGEYRAELADPDTDDSDDADGTEAGDSDEGDSDTDDTEA